ncbi:response regulator [Roseateles oligotrophus]|uniref:Response regulator n=1 Tax=Roseateles oligotrophus TaxID=1769250 RepID=A0ABT2Y9G7_9BURK|nr:response regulator [Roseateles oligotrophus]MCV2366918.1 response regulator [Roseateles oligotrophus]
MIKRRILVVEDERLIARDIAMQLCDLGYEPLGPAHTGEQAIKMAGQLRPDLVLMDVHLASAIDGIEAAQVIRAQFDVASVFLSAFSGDANSARAELAKPAGYLAKPFEDYELRETIEAAFKGG